MPRIPATLMLLTALFWTANPCQAQALLPDHESFVAERAGFEFELQGRYKKACKKFQEALDASLKDPHKDAGRQAARLEYLLRRLHFLFDKANDISGAESRFGALAKDDALPPISRDMARRFWIYSLELLGQHKDARAEEGPLGFIYDWQIIGPFDNERGTGFNQSFAPEKELNPKASYTGKSRAVQWRPMPVKGAFGQVDFNTLMRPNDQVLAYAVSYVKVNKDTAAALRVGSDESLKVWLNGQLLLAHDRQRPLSHDQSVSHAMLRKGWNAILVKVGEQTGSWGFRARLTKPEGGPLEGLQFASGAEIPELMSTVKHGQREDSKDLKVKADEGGLTWLQQRVKDQAEDVQARFELAYMYFTRQLDDKGQHRDRKLFEEAIKILNARMLKVTERADMNALKKHLSMVQTLYSLTAAASGEYSVNKEENKRRVALEKAISLWPQNAEAHKLLGQYYLNSLDNSFKARELFEQALKINPLYEEALYSLASVENRQSLGSVTIKREAELAGKLQTPEFFRLKARRALTAKQYPQAIDWNLKILKQRPGHVSARYSLVSLYRTQCHYEKAQELLEQLIAEDPYDISALDDLADLQEARGKPKAAIATIRRALDIVPEETALLKDLARRLRRQGDRANALRLYEYSLKIQPNDSDARKYVKYLKRKDKRVKSFEKPYLVDPKAVIAKGLLKAVDPRLTHSVLLQNKVIKVQKNGLASRFEQVVLRIENENGRQRFRRISRAYYVGEQHVTVSSVKVSKKDGQVVEVPGGESYDWGAGEFGYYSSYGVSLPPLEIGDVVEAHFRIDDLKMGFFGDFFQDSQEFRDTVPVQQSRLIYILPNERAFYFREHELANVQKQVRKSEAGAIYSYVAENVEKLEPEPYMPWAKESIPSLTVSTFKDWNAFARWYWALVKKQHESNEDIQKLVTELTKDCQSEDDKIRKVYEYVVSKIRYNDAWEFGVHGFKPYNATSIFARKFGDCKDKSTLINTMLRQLGIESYPVLIFGAQWPGDLRGQEDISLPMVGHFNHCISYVLPKGERKGLFLDGTAQFHPYGTLPSMDYGANVVVVTPKGALMKTVPMHSPDDNAVTEQAQVTVDAKGVATVKTVIRCNGSFAVVLRDELQTEGRRKTILERILGRQMTGVRVDRVKASELSDLSKEVRVEVDMTIEKALKKNGDAEALVPIRSWLFGLMSPKPRELATKVERKYDLVLPNPRQLEESHTIQLPPGTEIRALPKAVKLDTAFGQYELRYEKKGGKVQMIRRLKLKARRISTKDYKAFREFTTKIEEAEAEPLLIKRGEKNKP